MNRDPLGSNPLDKGIFSRTDSGVSKEKTSNQQPEARNHKPETINQEPVSGFSKDVEKVKITLQLPEDLNEWVDGLVKAGRKKHGHKIQKQTWIQAALEIMQMLPIDWSSFESPEQLRAELQKLSEQLKTINHKP